MTDCESDSEIQLSAHALAALLEFKDEEMQKQQEFQKLIDKANEEEAERKKREQGMQLFKENWQLSQFWYCDETADIFADALLEGADEDTVIAVISTPSVYAAILRKPAEQIGTKHIYLLEFDQRFSILSGEDKFLYYDFNKPLELGGKLNGKVDRLIVDPPFLNEYCQTNFSITAHALMAPHSNEKTKYGVEKHRFISSTGERMADVITKVHPGVKITDFYPEHANGLSNEFRCYADFECDKWKFEK